MSTATVPVAFWHDRLDPDMIGPCLLRGRRVEVIGQVRWGALVTRYQLRTAQGETLYADAAEVAPEPPPLLRLYRWMTGAAPWAR